MPRVTVAHPSLRELVDYDQYNGWLEAAEVVDLRARVSGYLLSIDFEPGQVVEAGAPLFTIDPRQIQSEVDRTAADVSRWEAELKRANASLTRAEKLIANGTITQEEYDRTVADHGVAKASLRSAQAAWEAANLNLEFTRITAPIAGRASRNLISRGNLVRADDTLLSSITSLDPFHCYFYIDERSMQRYQRNRRPPEPAAGDAPARAAIPFEFGLETDEGFPRRGTIDFADNRVDASTGTIQVRGVAENSERLLVSGARVRIRVPVSSPYRATLAPETALLSDHDRKYLLVVNPHGIVVRRDVRIGRLEADGMRVVLNSATGEPALLADDWVIVRGLQTARVNYPAVMLDEQGRSIEIASVD